VTFLTLGDKDNTPLTIASHHGHLDIVTFLMDHGANISARTNTGMTSLMFASWKGHLDIVEFLVNRGAKVNDIRSDGGQTSLMFASEYGHLEVVKFLVENKKDPANVDLKTKYNKTALDLARKQGKTEVVEYLEKYMKDIENAKAPKLLVENFKDNAPNQNIDVQFIETNSKGNDVFAVVARGGKVKGKFTAHPQGHSKNNSNANDYGITGSFNTYLEKQAGGKKTRKNRTRKNKTRKH
jgi:ankyrin repeat protein